MMNLHGIAFGEEGLQQCGSKIAEISSYVEKAVVDAQELNPSSFVDRFAWSTFVGVATFGLYFIGVGIYSLIFPKLQVNQSNASSSVKQAENRAADENVSSDNNQPKGLLTGWRAFQTRYESKAANRLVATAKAH